MSLYHAVLLILLLCGLATVVVGWRTAQEAPPVALGLIIIGLGCWALDVLIIMARLLWLAL